MDADRCGDRRIREVRAEELPLLQAIERAAGECFRAVGMPEIADDEPFPLAVLERFRRAGLAWVATDPADRPVAYLVAEPVDGALHVEQVSVHPDSARQGIGRALLEAAARHARALASPGPTPDDHESAGRQPSAGPSPVAMSVRICT